MTCRTTTYPQWLNYKKMENANYWQGCEVTGTLISSWYKYNSLQPLRNLKVSTESEHMCTLWPRNYTPSYIAKRNMHMYSPKCMHQTVNNSTIPNSPKVKLPKCPLQVEQIHYYIDTVENTTLRMNDLQLCTTAWISQTWYWAEESWNRRSHAKWFHLFKAQTQAKLIIGWIALLTGFLSL